MLPVTLIDPVDLVNLRALMERTGGSPEVRIGLIDGPILTQHPDLAGQPLRVIRDHNSARCAQASSPACLHGTFVAGILSARRSSPAPAMCPDCTVLIRPIYGGVAAERDGTPSAAAKELAAAIVECIDAGARVINLSLAWRNLSRQGSSQ